MRLKGVENVMRNLNREIKAIKGRSMAGLIRAAIFIRRDVDNTPPLIPVNTGNLRASWFITTGHGDMGGAGKFKGPRAAEMATDHAEVVTKASSKASAVRASNRPVLIMGFSANYATKVHESERPMGRWRRPGSGPKFFESTLKSNQAMILKIIADNARIR